MYSHPQPPANRKDKLLSAQLLLVAQPGRLLMHLVWEQSLLRLQASKAFPRRVEQASAQCGHYLLNVQRLLLNNLGLLPSSEDWLPNLF